MKRVIAALVLLLLSALPCAAGWEDVTHYLTVQYFTWEEHDAGRRILKESGPRFAAGVVARYQTGSLLAFRGRGELFGGEVDYSGETQAPASLPVKTQVEYFGTREEIDLGCRFPSSPVRLEPFVGLGHQWWLRGLEDTATADGTPANGYTENWNNVYTRAGLRGEATGPGGANVVAEAGVRYPVYVTNSVDFAGSGVTTFRPRGELSGFAQGGISYRRLRVDLFYEGTRFSQSPRKQVQGDFFFQPDSSSDVFGVNLGWSFK